MIPVIYGTGTSRWAKYSPLRRSRAVDRLVVRAIEDAEVFVSLYPLTKPVVQVTYRGRYYQAQASYVDEGGKVHVISQRRSERIYWK